MTLPSLTVMTLIPFVGGVLVFGLGQLRGGSSSFIRFLALAISLVTLGFAGWAWRTFDPMAVGMQLEETFTWIKFLGVQYHTGADGLSLLMVMLSAILVPMAILASWGIERNVHTYFGLILLLECGLLGTFTALSFFHWFIYWELSLVPAFFLIRLWGGPGRVEAATQFFVYTMAGSVALLLAFLAIFVSVGTFDFVQLTALGREGILSSALAGKLGCTELSARRLVLVIFGGVFLGFAVKVPLVPFHTWLPSTYAEAPTGVTMLLTGAMSKMGVYGFVRILVPLFPEPLRWVHTPLLWLAVLSIVAAAGAALAQTDLKRVLAYSSINHLGYCLLGLFAAAGAAGQTPALLHERTAVFNGVFLQMFNHGLTAAALFWLVGLLEQRNGGCRSLDGFGGLRQPGPVFCGLMGIALFSSLGLPGLNGFIGEFLIFKGAFALFPVMAAASTLGLLLTAVFILNILQRVFYGPLNPRHATFADLSGRERLFLAPAIALMFLLGIYPQLILGVVNKTAMGMANAFNY